MCYLKFYELERLCPISTNYESLYCTVHKHRWLKHCLIRVVNVICATVKTQLHLDLRDW